MPGRQLYCKESITDANSYFLSQPAATCCCASRDTLGSPDYSGTKSGPTRESYGSYGCNRDAIYGLARERRPERWSGETRNWNPIGTVYLNPERELTVVVKSRRETVDATTTLKNAA